MITNIIQKCGQIFRHFLPVETSLAFLLASVLMWPIPYIGDISPLLVLVAIYYWAIYRPDLFRPYIVFLLGLLNDGIHYNPLGLSALVFLGVYQLAFSNRRYIVGQIFYMLWAGFAVLALLAVVVMWAYVSLYNGQVMAISPVFVQYVLTVVIFPFPAWILIRLQRAFLSQDAT